MKQILKKIILKIANLLYLFYVRHLMKFFRFSSKPYLTGDSLRKSSDLIFENPQNFDANKLKDGDIVFVKTELITLFIKEYSKDISKKIKIITHNSDTTIEDTQLTSEINNNYVWFAQNLSLNKSKLVNIYPIPIGFENRNWLKNGKKSVLKNSQSNENKLNKVFCAFNTNTNEVRIQILNNIKDNSNFIFSRRTNHKDYMENLSKYKFSLCPPGNGLDTHRIWESLLVNTIPIVKSSEFIQNLINNIDIPILALENWKDLNTIDQEILNNKYEEMQNLFKDKSYLYVNYWMTKIRETNLIEK